MITSNWRQALGTILVGFAATIPGARAGAATDPAQVERGRYLVSIGSCSHCHTPGHFFGKDDMARYLGGSDVGFTLEDGTTVVGRNLTPDPETGLGNWSIQQIAKALRTGVRPDGRTLIPVMPWVDYQKMTEADALAIATFLKTLPPVHHRIDGPFAPKQVPTTFSIRMVPILHAPAKAPAATDAAKASPSAHHLL